MLGIAQIVVKPPCAAARAPLSIVSARSIPGSRRCACRSHRPGAATRPAVRSAAGRSEATVGIGQDRRRARRGRRLLLTGRRIDDPRTRQQEGRRRVVERPEWLIGRAARAPPSASATPLITWAPIRLRSLAARSAVISTPSLVGPGCSSGAPGRGERHAGRIETPARGVLAQRRDAAACVALELDAQRHHGIGIGQGILQSVGRPSPRARSRTLAPRPAGRPARPMRPGWSGMDVRARHPRMTDVARRSRSSCRRASPSASRSVSASRSAWVGCACVPSPAFTIRAAHAARRQYGAPLIEWRSTSCATPVRSQRPQRVDQGLALRHAARLDRELDDLRAECRRRPARSSPGFGSRARRRPAPTTSPLSRSSRFAAKAALAHLDRQVEAALHLVAGQLVDVEEVAVAPGGGRGAVGDGWRAEGFDHAAPWRPHRTALKGDAQYTGPRLWARYHRPLHNWCA